MTDRQKYMVAAVALLLLLLLVGFVAFGNWFESVNQ
jgi:Flp pilus assembly protein TadG